MPPSNTGNHLYWMDDDSLDYVEDYSFSDSCDQDEDIRQELELDEILLNVNEDRNASLLRLSEIAGNFSSICCVKAGLELLKLKPGPESFKKLVEAVAGAPGEVDNYTRASTLKSGWSLLERHLRTLGRVEIETLLQIQGDACLSLKQAAQIRPYFQLMLCAVRTFIVFRYFEQASDLLCGIFYGEIKSYEHNIIWASSLVQDARILHVELLIIRSHIDTLQVREILEAIKGSDIVMDPIQNCIVEEIHARLCLEGRQFQESRAILEKVVRSYEESQGLQRSSKLLARSRTLLLLVTAILRDVPAESNTRTESMTEVEFTIVQHAINVSQILQNPLSQSPQFKRELAAIQRYLNADDWKLGSATLIRELKRSFDKRQVEHALTPYNRMRWSSIRAQVDKFQRSGALILADPLVRQIMTVICNEKYFQLNLIDDTIDRQNSIPEWKSCASKHHDLSRIVPLPDTYANHLAARQVQLEESAILNKWKLTSKDANLAKAQQPRHSLEVEIMQLLQDTLNDHRNAMMA